MSKTRTSNKKRPGAPKSMTKREIAQAAMTLKGEILAEIATMGEKSRFVQVGRNKFALRTP